MVALLAHQSDLELLDDERTGAGGNPLAGASEASSWLERNRRVVQRYQSLVRSAVTLDALIEQELGSDQLGSDQLGGGATPG